MSRAGVAWFSANAVARSLTASMALLATLSASCGGRTRLESGSLGDGAPGGAAAGGSGGARAPAAHAGTAGATPAFGGTTAAGAAGSGQGGGRPPAASSGSGGSPLDAGPPDAMPQDAASPLWRMSFEPFCEREAGALDWADVWSDSRGVYALVGQDVGVTSVHLNTGFGWRSVATRQSGSDRRHLSGFAGGPLVVYGAPPCTVEFWEDGASSCSGAANSVQDVFTLTADLAYAVYRDRLLRFDGQLWRQLGAPLRPVNDVFTRGVWASGDTVLVGADAGRLYRVPAGEVRIDPEPNVPPSDILTVWGFAADDLWAGNRDGQLLHYDGNTWGIAWSSEDDCRAIVGMWGSDDQLFFHSSAALRVLQNGQVRTLARWPCRGTAHFETLWGNSPSEVFVAVHDEGEAGKACGHVRLMWFDGDSLRPL